MRVGLPLLTRGMRWRGRQLFELNVEAGALQKEADDDGSGSIEYAELKKFLVDQNVSLCDTFK
jgi:hypothetical protein